MYLLHIHIIMIKENKIPLKCYYVLVYIFLCPLYYNLNVMGDQNNMNYLPSWDDLDTRSLPQWYDNAKIGILIDWGAHSVLDPEDELILTDWPNGVQDSLSAKENYSRIVRKYEDLAPMFKADKFNPDVWAKVFVQSGARYVVVTAKYKDGFTLFSSDRHRWSSVEIGPKKDIVRILSHSIKAFGMKFGVYYSLTEWFNKLFIAEKEQDDKKEFATAYVDKIILPEIKYLLEQYEPSVLWSDGDDDVRCSEYWKSTEILAWIYNESPVKDEIVVNDRWSSCTRCLHGDFFSSDKCYKDITQHKWENPVRLDKASKNYIRNIKVEDVLNINETLEVVVSTVSRGGNVLIVVGPTKDGIIAVGFQERLRQLGNWLKTYDEAIYNTSRWIHQKDSYNPNVWYTCTIDGYHKEGSTNASIHSIRTVYVILLRWPDDNVLRIVDLITYIMDEDVHISLIRPSVAQTDHTDKKKKKKNKKAVNKKYIPLNHAVYNGTLDIHLPKIKFDMCGWVLKVEFTDITMEPTDSVINSTFTS